MSALRAAGHEVVRWKPGERVVDGELAVVFGLAALNGAGDVGCDILLVVDRADLGALCAAERKPADLAVLPIDPEELVARVALRAGEPTRRERTHQRLLASAVTHAHDIIELMDPVGTLEYVNPAYERTFGVRMDEVVGQLAPHVEGVTDDSTSTLTKSQIAMTRGQAWSGVLVSSTPGRERRHFDAKITPVKNRRGEITHFVSVKRDITERLDSQAELIQANDALQRARDAAVTANKAKSDFLANMSHELRTPLNAIIGYSELLAEDLADDEQASKDLGRIIAAARHLLSLINEVLDLAKIEARKVTIHVEEVFVRDVVDEAIAEVRPLAERNSNRLEVIAKDAPQTIRTDPLRMRQVLTNLLSNACKFTEGGDVTLEVRTRDADIELIVRDTGIGISSENQATLFQPFVQADSSDDRRYGGTGLGLAITAQLCALLGGGISLQSELGVGSTFTVTLPRTAPDA